MRRVKTFPRDPVPPVIRIRFCSRIPFISTRSTSGRVCCLPPIGGRQHTLPEVDRVEMNGILEQKRILITGGTGSLGKVLTRRILSGEAGHPAKVIIFSRDEAKQHFIRVEYENRVAATDEIIYRNFQRLLEFRIGDVRDYGSVASVLRDADIVVNAAAMKQVPTCEYFPYEAVRTNVGGAENIVRAIQEHT